MDYNINDYDSFRNISNNNFKQKLREAYQYDTKKHVQFIDDDEKQYQYGIKNKTNTKKSKWFKWFGGGNKEKFTPAGSASGWCIAFLVFFFLFLLALAIILFIFLGNKYNISLAKRMLGLSTNTISSDYRQINDVEPQVEEQTPKQTYTSSPTLSEKTEEPEKVKGGTMFTNTYQHNNRYTPPERQESSLDKLWSGY